MIVLLAIDALVGGVAVYGYVRTGNEWLLLALPFVLAEAIADVRRSRS